MAQLPINIRHEKRYKMRRSPPIEDYKALYRFNKENVKWIASHFLGETHETRGGALTMEQRMKIFLRYLADPGFQSGIAEELGVHRSTVCKTINGVADMIMQKSDTWIRFPSTADDIAAAKIEWLDTYKFPSAIGVLDCTHVRIPKPGDHGDEYINRKGYPSINVQATCNAKEWFTSIVVDWPGSVHDSKIWKNSTIREVIRRHRNTVLLGDEGYGLEPWLMTPYRNPVEDKHRRFNRLLKEERVVIERCLDN